jgi:hypothetical protein
VVKPPVRRPCRFERGSFYGRIQGARPGREWSMGEQELLERLKAGEEP